MASIHLTVSRAFGPYRRGAIINDPATIDAVLAGPNRHDVVRAIAHPAHESGAFWKTDAARGAATVVDHRGPPVAEDVKVIKAPKA